MRSQKTDEELRRIIQARTGIKGYQASIEAIRIELELRKQERQSQELPIRQA